MINLAKFLGKNTKKFFGILGVVSIGFNSLNAQDSLKIEHGLTNDSVPYIEHTINQGDSILREKRYVKKEDSYKLMFEKTTNFDEQGKPLYVSEREYSYKESLENPYGAPKNLLERKRKEKYEEYNLSKLFIYNEAGRLERIENKNIKKGNLINGTEYFLYPSEKNQPIKWEDNNGNGKFDEGDILEVYNPKKEEWIEFIEKKE